MTKKLIYENTLSTKEAVADFVLEGKAVVEPTGECLRMKNAISSEHGQKANYVLWCPKDFPANIRIEWDFKPITDIGLCILFFAAKGRNGEDLFSDSLAVRTGDYMNYHSGDINAFHVSYFRRKEPEERAFRTLNLRKSHGFYLVAQGGDPMPPAEDITDFYHIACEKNENIIKFFINDVCLFTFEDDGKTYGDFLGGGKIGFRQLAPLVAEYKNLKVYELCK